MKKSIKMNVIFIAVVLITCAISAVLTYFVCNQLSENKEDKMLISLVGEERAGQLENSRYKFSRIYILKDGTTIEGVGGSGNGTFQIK